MQNCHTCGEPPFTSPRFPGSVHHSCSVTGRESTHPEHEWETIQSGGLSDERKLAAFPKMLEALESLAQEVENEGALAPQTETAKAIARGWRRDTIRAALSLAEEAGA